jgi:MFS family permease
MNDTKYTIAVSLFSLAYFLFEVPSNWIMKRYVRPSLWLGMLLLCWGVLTIGFAVVQNFTTVDYLRYLIGALEADFFPGELRVVDDISLKSHRIDSLSRDRLPHHVLVSC